MRASRAKFALMRSFCASFSRTYSSYILCTRLRCSFFSLALSWDFVTMDASFNSTLLTNDSSPRSAFRTCFALAFLRFCVDSRMNAATAFSFPSSLSTDDAASSEKSIPNVAVASNSSPAISVCLRFFLIGAGSDLRLRRGCFDFDLAFAFDLGFACDALALGFFGFALSA